MIVSPNPHLWTFHWRESFGGILIFEQWLVFIPPNTSLPSASNQGESKLSLLTKVDATERQRKQGKYYLSKAATAYFGWNRKRICIRLSLLVLLWGILLPFSCLRSLGLRTPLVLFHKRRLKMHSTYPSAVPAVISSSHVTFPYLTISMTIWEGGQQGDICNGFSLIVWITPDLYV